MTASTRSPRRRVVAAALVLTLVVTACGDDDDEATTSTTSTTSTTLAEAEGASTDEAFCAASAELDEGDGPPTVEQMEELKDLGPDAISDEVDFAADAIIAAEGDFGAAFGQEGVEEAVGVIETWEEENCESDFAVAPENQEYCEAIEEIDGQDGPPTNDQLEELKEIRPDSVGEDTDMVVDAFLAADGDLGQVFSDPEIEAALGRMEEHDAEVCGIEQENEDEEQETEAAEGSEVIPVIGVDFAFEGIPAEIGAGPVAFEFSNDGEAVHELVLFKLGEGFDLDTLLASDEEPTEEEAEEVGGAFAPPGEGGVYANVDLDPGSYAVICFIPGPGGKSHADLGMRTTFTVT